MIKQFSRLLSKYPALSRYNKSLYYMPLSSFCSKDVVPPPKITAHENDGVAYFELDNISGTKEGGPIYAVIFTCGPCGHKMARTFTQNAYHNGVVLVRCDSCQNIHLMADNLGWFEDGKWNIETHAKAKKITSPEVKAILDGFIANMK